MNNPSSAVSPDAPVFGHTGYDAQANRLLAETIVKVGAFMVTARPCVQVHVIGHIAWLGEQHCFWLELKPSRDVLPRVFEYDEFCRVGHRGVAFFHREEIVAYLSTIHAAGTAEPVGARPGDKAPAVAGDPPRRDTICGWCEQASALTGGHRHCAWHLPRCAADVPIP